MGARRFVFRARGEAFFGAGSWSFLAGLGLGGRTFLSASGDFLHEERAT